MLIRFTKKIKRSISRTALVVSAVFIGGVSSLGIVPLKAFAVAPDAPINLRTWVGGDSIALTWNPAPGQVPTQYEVYRDGSYYDTVLPSTINVAGDTQRYIDGNVTNGQSYSYYIVAYNAASEASSPSSTVGATQPSSPVPVPTITIASGRPSDVLPYLQAGKDLLEVWYPKIVTKLGNPTGTATSFTITSAANTNTAAYVSGTTMTVDEGYARSVSSVPSATDLFIHEGTHIATGGGLVMQNTPNWVDEGIADYIKYYMYGSNTTTAPNGYTYLAGYERAGYVFNYVATNFNKPDFVKDLYANAIAGGDLDAFIKTQTGTNSNNALSLGELWSNVSGTKVSTVLKLKNAAASNSCADVWSSTDANNATVDIYTCNGTTAQQWTFVPFSNTGTEGFIRVNMGGSTGGGQQRCLHAKNNATADGTDVVLYQCNVNTAGMKWVIQTNGSIKNVQSGRCLQPQNASTTNATILEIVTCNSSVSAQNWNVRPLSVMQSTATTTTAVNYCVTSQSGNPPTGSYSYVQNNNCTYAESQLLEYVQSSPGSNDGSYRIYGQTKCLDLLNGATSDGTRVIFTDCNGSDSQKWVRNPSTRLSNVASNTCLQLENNATTSGTYLVISTCNSNASQKWKWATM